ncbi:MAG: hypothetical protein GWP09_02950 [Nitrospiraceae bacterium]|nr:hypothetical protein [Nitrospiraceae bacterium]
METVEVWMWIIAGMVIASFILASSFTIVGKHLHNEEIMDCSTKFESLYNLLGTTCVGGEGSVQSEQIVIPFAMQKLYVKNESNVEGYGNILCYKVEGKLPFCKKLSYCKINMSTISLGEKTGLFSMISKTLGSNHVATIEFTVSKVSGDILNVSWRRIYTK